MSHYKPYPAYKDSGVEWIGRVPEHWGVKAFKRLASIRNGQDYKDVADPGGAYPVIGSGGEFARASSFMFDGESVLLGRKGTIDKPLYINGPFWTVDTMFYTTIANDAFPRFVYYSALTIPFGLYSTNTALPSMTGEDISSHVIAAPEFAEQKAIARVLDRETSRIDALIAKKTRFIELLKEKRQALITHAVTKGLNSDVPMKDSGVEWIGEVPEHWDVLRIKRAAALRNERRNNLPDGWTYIGLEDVEPESGRYAPTKGESRQSDDSMVGVSRAGDVLYGKLRPYLRKAIVAECDGACSTEFLVLIADRVAATWLHRWLLTPDVTQQIEAGCYGAKMPRADWQHVGSIPMPLPPLAEQATISVAIDREASLIDALIAKTQRSIDLIKERRAAFITAAVTGQIDLRDQL